MYGVARRGVERPYVVVGLNGKRAKMLLDTGAEANVVDPATAIKAGMLIEPSSAVINTVDGTPAKVVGEGEMEVTLGNECRNVEFIITETHGVEGILGAEWLAQTGQSLTARGGEWQLAETRESEEDSLRKKDAGGAPWKADGI